MKTLHYRRHSKKDPDNTLSRGGIHLAVQEGSKAWHYNYRHLFHGPLVRTAQTALAFCKGLGYVPEIMPVVHEIGTDELFAEIATSEFWRAVEGGASYFQALLVAHDETKAQEWAGPIAESIHKMLDDIDDNQTAIVFGHSPVIELAAWIILGFKLPEGHDRLDEMEGIVFATDDVGKICSGPKITVD